MLVSLLFAQALFCLENAFRSFDDFSAGKAAIHDLQIRLKPGYLPNRPRGYPDKLQFFGENNRQAMMRNHWLRKGEDRRHHAALNTGLERQKRARIRRDPVAEN